MSKMADGNGIFKMVKAAVSGIRHGEYEGDELQLPEVFVIGEDSTLTYVHYAKNIGDMPEIKELIRLMQ